MQPTSSTTTQTQEFINWPENRVEAVELAGGLVIITSVGVLFSQRIFEDSLTSTSRALLTSIPINFLWTSCLVTSFSVLYLRTHYCEPKNGCIFQGEGPTRFSEKLVKRIQGTTAVAAFIGSITTIFGAVAILTKETVLKEIVIQSGIYSTNIALTTLILSSLYLRKHYPSPANNIAALPTQA